MKKSFMKKNIFLKIMSNSLIFLPTPMNISYLWNFGSMLGLCLIIQIISGFFLSMHYSPNINLAFQSIIHIIQDVNNGWVFRLIHLNGASLFFICMYIHIGRNIYYNSFLLNKTWNIGVLIFLLTMMTAFLGYVLPWGQMSYWGATVITNLISAIPYLGKSIVEWVWGGFSVNNATLNRFYSLHFILPIMIFMMMLIHLTFLHETGSNNPLGMNSNLYKIPFNPYFTIKDSVTMIMMMILLLSICLLNPYLLSDPENFMKANSMITPIHIQPEWYFLFAYAILRSIPNKLGGVIALIMSILILLILPMFKYNLKGSQFFWFNQMNFWVFTNIFIILTWIGARPVEEPYLIISQIFSMMYFSFFFTYPIMNLFMYKLMKQ